jgi:hypothetical protein
MDTGVVMRARARQDAQGQTHGRREQQRQAGQLRRLHRAVQHQPRDGPAESRRLAQIQARQAAQPGRELFVQGTIEAEPGARRVDRGAVDAGDRHLARRVARGQVREDEGRDGHDEHEGGRRQQPAHEEAREAGDHLPAAPGAGAETNSRSAFHNTGGSSTEGVTPRTRALIASRTRGAAKWMMGRCSASRRCASANSLTRSA